MSWRDPTGKALAVSQRIHRVSSTSSNETEATTRGAGSSGSSSGDGGSSSGRGSAMSTPEDDTGRILEVVGGGLDADRKSSAKTRVQSTSGTSQEERTGMAVFAGPAAEQPEARTSPSQSVARDTLGLASHRKPADRSGVPGAVRAPPSKKGHPAGAAAARHLLILVLFLVGLIVCVSSVLCLLLLPSFVTQQIAKKLVLKNNSMLLERWSKPNVPMYFKVWLYDIKNAQEIVDKRDTRPRLEEIGPFVFNLRRQKDVISFAGDNLYYTERKVYHFNRELSCCAINTTVTIPNIPLVAVVDRALSYNLPLVGRFIPRLINRAIQSLREQLFVRKQVREILFDGYDVELLRMVSRVGSLVGLPQQSQRFALLKGRNDTWRPEQDGVWAINTGQRDRRQFGRVSSWNSYKRLPFWAEPQCNVINGSDGTLFPPPIRRTEPLYIFNQELCRTVNLVFERPSDVRSIKALRFVLNPLNFAHTMAPGSGAASAATATAAAAGAAGPAASAQPAATPALLAAVRAHQLANQTAAAARTRINPIFQNRDRLAPARPNDALDPITILGVPAAPLPMPTPPRHRMGVGSGQPAPRTSAQPQARQRVAASRLANQNDVLRPSASESHTTRPEGTGAPARADVAGASPAPKNLLDATSRAADARLAAEEKIRREQEKLIEVAQEAQLANERKSQANPQTCFCDRKQTNLNGVNVCEFDGLIDLSKCSKQAQVIFGSMPHFYNSDPRLLRQVTGLAPNASKHTTYLDIEPNTGLVLGGKRRVQLNVIIKHNNEIDGFENINDMLVPIVWFEESAMIPEEAAQKFRAMYVDRIRLVNYILCSLLIASIALLAIDARLMLATRYWRNSKWRLAAASADNHPRPPEAPGAPGTKSSVASSSRGVRTYKANKLAHGHQGDPGGRAATAADAALPLAKGRSFTHLNGSADSPLLQESRSSLNSTTPGSSPHVSPPETPEGSPELRKWSLSQHHHHHHHNQISGQGTTRVYLNGVR